VRERLSVRPVLFEGILVRYAVGALVVLVAALAAACGNGTGPSSCTSPPAASVSHFSYYVAPSGSSSGDGSSSRPWDLPTALAGGNGRVHPGDTVWLRAGTYAGEFRTCLTGTATDQIVFRQFPGARATIDGTLRADGAYLTFWGFEIMQSVPFTYGLQANTNAGHFINLVVHDAGNQGVSFWTPGENAELYGCLIYNNGIHDNLDHGAYVHNETGTKLLADNVFFDNFARGIQVYASSNNPAIRNVQVEGNVAFNNGSISSNVSARQNLVINAQVSTSGMVARDNLLYYSPGEDGVQLRLGNVDPSNNHDIAVDSNYAVGGAVGLQMRLQWTQGEVKGNTLVGGSATDIVETGGNEAGYQWAGNTYYRDSTALAWLQNDAVYNFAAWKAATGLGGSDQVVATGPSTTQVFLRPNKYEAGRGFVIVYNFAQQASVNVDLSSVLTLAKPFAIRNVQDVFGAPVVSGSFAGGMVSIPMGGVQPPLPIGRSTRQAPKTGPSFDVFLVTSP
jgi:hypothetical protein